MNKWLAIIAIVLAILTQSIFAQDTKEPVKKSKGMEKKEAVHKDMAMESKDAGESMTPPVSLKNDPWMKWMIGEWEGTTESPMGTSKDWMKLEFALDGQFVIAHYKSEATTVNKEMAMQMGMTEEQMKAPYSGMGVFTLDPKTGEAVDYWFDNWRSISSGKGKRVDNVETTNWESAMGSEVRTLEKKGENDMVMTFKMTMAGSDQAMEGKTVLKRK